MPQLEHYTALWGLAAPRLLATTRTSRVYHALRGGEEVVLKLLTPLGQADESAGAAALRHFAGHGACRLLAADEGAHLLEYLPGETLVPVVQTQGDEAAALIIADVLNALHAAPPAVPGGLIALDVWFRALLEGRPHHELLATGAAVARALLAHPQDVRVLHGDIHHENIRHKPGRGWLAYDPKGLIGERAYDAANTFLNPCDMPRLVVNEARALRLLALMSERLRLEPGRLLRFVFAYACLSAAWSLEDGDDPEEALAVAALLRPHL
jgi:streptomycin 6-kinase